MALLAWFAIGSGLLVLVLVLSLVLNRKKRTARLAVRLAEAYRSRGQFEAALALYQVPAELDQIIEEAREGRLMAEQELTDPVMDAGLVEGACQLLEADRDRLTDYFEQREIAVDLPPLLSPRGEGDDAAG